MVTPITCTHRHMCSVTHHLSVSPLGIQPSSVHGFIYDGLFSGVVRAGSETYHLEPSWRYFDKRDTAFHSIMYRIADVKYRDPDSLRVTSWVTAKHEHSHSSGGSPKSGAFPGHHPSSRKLQSVHTLTRWVTAPPCIWYSCTHVWSQEDILGRVMSFAVAMSSPSRRAIMSNRSFCLLRVAVDHRFFTTVGGSSAIVVRNEIATLFREVNEIFAQTDFDFDGHPDGIQFHIPEVEILTDPALTISGVDKSSLSLEEMLKQWADVSVH